MSWNANWARYVKDFAFDAGFVSLLFTFVTLRTLQWKAKPQRLLLAFGTLFFALYCFRGSVEYLVSPLRSRAKLLTAESQARHCITSQRPLVVLGGGAWSPTLLSESSLQRVVTAADIFLATPSKERTVVFTGGMNRLAGVVEASLQAQHFRQLVGTRAAEARILEETKSENTYENALLTKELFDNAGIEKDIVLVTSDYHLPRSVAAFKNQGFQVCPFSAPSPDLRSVGLINFFNAHNVSRVLNEYLGVAGYWAKGWL